MQLRFTKMHGLGNDFIVLESVPEAALSEDAWRRLADRRTGIGFDQALLVEPARAPGSDLYYRVINADGREVEQCGNGARCIARLVGERRGLKAGETLTMDSPGGIVRASLGEDGEVSVDMGVPDFRPQALPFIASTPAYLYTLDIGGSEVEFGAVSVGNPHAVIRVSSVDSAPLDRLGPAIERHERFPQRTNVGFMEVVDRTRVRLRVHERGTGETRACGTGACAAVAVGRRHGLLDEEVTVDLLGGRLTIRWPGDGHPIWMTGPAEAVFEGSAEVRSSK